MIFLTPISVPTPVYIDLIDYLRDYGDERDPSEVATLAIRAWLAAATGEAGSLPAAGGRGYQWKDVFLPEASELRMQYDDSYYYARVVGDAIIYQGQEVTPAQMVNAIAGGTRNAWRDLWLRIPGERKWTKAAQQRKQQNKGPAADLPPAFELASPANASTLMAASLRNALALIEKAGSHRKGRCERRTDILPDD